MSLRFRADQVVSGVAINLLAIGLTRFLLKLLFDSSSNSPRVDGFGDDRNRADRRSDRSSAARAAAWLVYRTPFGLRVRAVGEHPRRRRRSACGRGAFASRPWRSRGMLAALGGA